MKKMVTTNTTNISQVFTRLARAALGNESDKSTCEISKNDLATLLMAYRFELGNQNKELPVDELPVEETRAIFLRDLCSDNLKNIFAVDILIDDSHEETFHIQTLDGVPPAHSDIESEINALIRSRYHEGSTFEITNAITVHKSLESSPIKLA
ncbi:hypothetical protein H8F18_23235 [Vibrio fluvialis]|uniref:hypothetical protein n=2 Tax=Vibrio TaxID=662 RepID=UPI00192C569D|nr:hypothetical protein [Vibrio fluvialis]MBL4245328.1 hypothetical protein [Vibrio fluvialis]MBL4254268.1 hypothetical protein [Vibrio fluvialis]HBK7909249.1 hypothetical protein [Vibrio cholerae]